MVEFFARLSSSAADLKYACWASPGCNQPHCSAVCEPVARGCGIGVSERAGEERGSGILGSDSDGGVFEELSRSSYMC